jgi:hypothetical protein
MLSIEAAVVASNAAQEKAKQMGIGTSIQSTQHQTQYQPN